MGLLRRINAGLSKGKTEVKAPADTPIRGLMPLSATTNITKRLQIDFESLTKWAYRGNELVHACIGERGRALREAPLRIFDEKDDKWEEGHDVELLMKNPNPFRSQAEFWESVEQHLLLTGNAFIYKARDTNGRVAQLWLKKPHLMKIVPDPTKFIKHYIYQISGQEYILPVEDVIHVKYIDPDNEYYGIAPLVAAAKKVDADSELGSFTKYILLNMATTSGVFVTDKKLGADERQIIEEKMAHRYVGALRAGLPMVLSHGMKFEKTSMNMKELEIGNLAAYVESRICLALHVPAIVVGAKVGLDRSTFTNVREAREYMYENTISPEWQMLAEKIGNDLLREFDATDGLIPKFDTRYIKALQESESDLWERVDKFEGLSIIEKRVKIGYPRDPDGIVFLDANRVPVDITTGEGTVPQHESTPTGTAPKEEPEEEEEENAEEDGEKKKPETKARLISPPTEDQKQELLDNLVNIEKRYLPVMLEVTTRLFEGIALEVMEHLDRRGIKTLEIKDYQQTLDEVLLKQRIETMTERNMRSNITEILSESAEGTRQTLGYGFGLTNQEAVKYAKEHTNKLSGSIASTSVNDVRETIAKGIEEGKDLRTVRKELMEKVDGWSKERAETVARTETLTAANQGSLAMMKTVGIEYKEFLAAPDACPLCKSMAEQINAIDEDFVGYGNQVITSDSDGETSIMTNSYSDMVSPPLHPRCRCTIAGIPASEVQEKEVDNPKELAGVWNKIDPAGDFGDIRWSYGNMMKARQDLLGEGVKQKFVIRRYGNRLNIIMKDTGEAITKKALTGAYDRIYKGPGWLSDIAKKAQGVVATNGADGSRSVLVSALAGGRPPMVVDFGSNINSGLVNAWMGRLDDLTAKYPEVSKLITQVGSHGLVNTEAVAETGVKGRYRTINYNPVYASDTWTWSIDKKKKVQAKDGYNFLNDEMKDFHAKGGSTISSIEEITTHEYGHVLEDYLKRKGFNTWLPKEGHVNIRVSDYAMKNQAEHFAESFVMYEKGIRSAPETKLIDELIKKAGLLQP